MSTADDSTAAEAGSVTAGTAEGQAPLNLVDLIDQLAEPAEPPLVPLKPQTEGWAVLALVLALLLAWLLWRGWRRWQANAYRRAALTELHAAGDDAAAIADILRRTALAVWPRREVAHLAGPDWLAFLDRTGGGEEFSNGPGRALLRAPYQPDVLRAPEGLQELAGRWVRHHRVGRTDPEPAG